MQIPGAAVFENHTFPAASNSYLLFHFGEDESPVIIRNSDVSMTTDLVDGLNSATYKGQTLFQCCKVHASLAQTSPTYRYSRVRFEGCDDGTITVPPLGIHKDYQENGTISSTTVVYRTDGADDGEQANAYSWEMAADASALELYSCLDSSPITTWVEAGAQDITIYVASGGTLNDDDFWIEVESPNETASPNTTAMGQTNTTRAGFRDTPTALTTDSSSTWNGSGVGTKQEVTVSITPAVAGPVTVRCFLAKPSTTVYVDPKISTDGNQRLFEGVQVDGAAAGGGVAPLINGGLIS